MKVIFLSKKPSTTYNTYLNNSIENLPDLITQRSFVEAEKAVVHVQHTQC